jgi:glycosyltransferase involved in cell wall biosynthesis
MINIGLVIPCYNEERRIDLEYWDALANRGDIFLVFVNDGSTDLTNKILEEL